MTLLHLRCDCLPNMIETVVWIANLIALTGLIVQLDNLRFFPRLRALQCFGESEVDVCIAMRDEALTALLCCQALLAQRVVRQIIVIDDGSTDATFQLLQHCSIWQPRLVVAKATGCGKVAALAQAARLTQAPMLFFTDADVVVQNGGIDALVRYAQSAKVAAVSVWPRIANRSVFDALLCPAITLFLLQALPMRWATGTNPRFSAATGQAFLVRRDAYNAAGGHAALQTLVEDVELAMHLKRSGYRIALASGSALFTAQGYGSFNAASSGLGRSLYFSVGFFGSLSFGVWQSVVFVFPWIAAYLNYRWAWISIVLCILARAILARRMNHAWESVVFTPVAGLLSASIAFLAALTGGVGRFRWRGRLADGILNPADKGNKARI